MDKLKVGIIGPGNIGTDLLLKLLRSDLLDPVLMVGIVESSKGLNKARSLGVKTSHNGIDDLLKEKGIKIAFDATGVKSHREHAPLLEKAGIIAIDLTPAAIGPFVVPSVNLEDHLSAKNVNLITCGAQATVPIIRAISNVVSVEYAEIVSTISSKSAGIGTRQNIDEFTQTTARSLEIVGGAKKGKAIIVLNPAEPPIMMQNTVYAMVDPKSDVDTIIQSIKAMVDKIKRYLPGYKLKHEPDFDNGKITVLMQVEGAGDYLSKYSGNLDIITSAAVATGEAFALNLNN